MRDYIKLQELLGYTFNDLAILRLALTHRSYSRQNNERMEFIGDSILDYVIAMNLYSRYPKCSEGDLSKIRAALVSQDTLVEIANKIGLGEYLLLGSGEEKSGGRKRPSILGDCVEALIAAVALDSSDIMAAKVIEQLFDEYLDNAEQLISKDFKSILQECLQSRKLGLPIYQLHGTDGPDHCMVFHMDCIIPALKIKVTAQGRNKKEASQVAAQRALAEIELFDAHSEI
ncbi:MAG: ribonuclease [Burkholderiales bacterium]|jgi:ribonuclease-3|nr:ribonuclease [Burkholderiales bacterium]